MVNEERRLSRAIVWLWEEDHVSNDAGRRIIWIDRLRFWGDGWRKRSEASARRIRIGFLHVELH